MILKHSLFDNGPPPACPARFNLAAHTLFGVQPAEKIALTVAGARPARWTYAALRDAVARTAGGLRLAGLKRGERVLLRLGNSADFPIVYLGAIAAGGVAVPTSTQLSAHELRHIATDVGARFACIGPGLGIDGLALETLDPQVLRDSAPADPADTSAGDPAFIVYTSGSSGKPKGVAHAQRAGWARRMMWEGWYGLGATDTMLHAGAFNWTYTLGAGLLDPWAAGAATVIHDGPPDPGLWSRLAHVHGATIFAATPGVYRQLLKYGVDVGEGFAGLRHGLSAGEKLPETLAAAWRAETGKPVYEALGMSEVSTYVSGAPGAAPPPGFIGRPQPGRRVAVLATGTERIAPLGVEGDLAVSCRDPGLMLGYWNLPEETAAAFRGEWFITGDRAAMDAEGHVAYLGRADDMINAGGYRVAPQEVEDALLAHPGVVECAAVALPVREDVTILAAFVVAPGLDSATLHAWCAARLAAYKQPRRITMTDSLPRTATGKLRRRALIAGS